MDALRVLREVVPLCWRQTPDRNGGPEAQTHKGCRVIAPAEMRSRVALLGMNEMREQFDTSACAQPDKSDEGARDGGRKVFQGLCTYFGWIAKKEDGRLCQASARLLEATEVAAAHVVADKVCVQVVRVHPDKTLEFLVLTPVAFLRFELDREAARITSAICSSRWQEQRSASSERTRAAALSSYS